jgi:hypothetical protein
MATYLDVLNAVQRRLRETVSSDVETTDYDTLLAIFIDDAKRQLEDIFMWYRYREIVEGNTADDDDTFDLGSGTSQRTTVEKGWNTTSADPLRKMPLRTIIINQLASTVSKGTIDGYHWGGGDSTDGTTRLHIYPRADGVQALKFWVYNPPVDLRGTVKTTVYNGPAHVIELGAYLRAIAERGESGGMSYQIAKLDYDRSVHDMLHNELQQFGGFQWNNEWGADNIGRNYVSIFND